MAIGAFLYHANIPDFAFHAANRIVSVNTVQFLTWQLTVMQDAQCKLEAQIIYIFQCLTPNL